MTRIWGAIVGAAPAGRSTATVARSAAPAERSAFPTEAPTDEAAWLTFIGGLPVLDAAVSERASRAVFVAPHPDDETLGCGGLMAELSARRCAVEVVAVTDGEGSHPGHGGLAGFRRREQERALVTLGVGSRPIRLGLPDGHVTDHADRLADRLADLTAGADLVVAPWRADGHTDHDASGAAAAEATRRNGARLLEYPVWAWQWARPDDLARLAPVRFDLSTGVVARKRAAIGCFASQTTGRLGRVLLPEPVLARFRRRCEVFVDGR